MTQRRPILTPVVFFAIITVMNYSPESTVPVLSVQSQPTQPNALTASGLVKRTPSVVDSRFGQNPADAPTERFAAISSSPTAPFETDKPDLLGQKAFTGHPGLGGSEVIVRPRNERLEQHAALITSRAVSAEAPAIDPQTVAVAPKAEREWARIQVKKSSNEVKPDRIRGRVAKLAMKLANLAMGGRVKTPSKIYPDEYVQVEPEAITKHKPFNWFDS